MEKYGYNRIFTITFNNNHLDEIYDGRHDDGFGSFIHFKFHNFVLELKKYKIIIYILKCNKLDFGGFFFFSLSFSYMCLFVLFKMWKNKRFLDFNLTYCDSNSDIPFGLLFIVYDKFQ